MITALKLKRVWVWDCLDGCLDTCRRPHALLLHSSSD
jgi:hypothetical protein